jgi:hypothetical protein
VVVVSETDTAGVGDDELQLVLVRSEERRECQGSVVVVDTDREADVRREQRESKGGRVEGGACLRGEDASKTSELCFHDHQVEGASSVAKPSHTTTQVDGEGEAIEGRNEASDGHGSDAEGLGQFQCELAPRGAQLQKRLGFEGWFSRSRYLRRKEAHVSCCRDRTGSRQRRPT